MITTKPQLQESFPHLADILVENSVLIKWLNKHMYVLFNGDNMDSS